MIKGFKSFQKTLYIYIGILFLSYYNKLISIKSYNSKRVTTTTTKAIKAKAIRRQTKHSTYLQRKSSKQLKCAYSPSDVTRNNRLTSGLLTRMSFGTLEKQNCSPNRYFEYFSKQQVIQQSVKCSHMGRECLLLKW